MKTKLTTLFLAGGLLMGGIALASPDGKGECPQAERQGGPGARNPQERLDRAAERLDLTDDQKAQFEAVMTETHEKRMAIRDSASDPDERHAQMMALNQETDAKLATFLSDAQLAEFQAMRAQRMAQHMEKRAEMEARKAETIERLQLSADQEAQFNAILDAQREAAHAMRAEARSSGERPDREAMKAQRQETDAKINAILTPAQQKEWEVIKAERKAEMKEHRGHGPHGGPGGPGAPDDGGDEL